jgi:molybdenum cofactor cytidylyltransferase
VTDRGRVADQVAALVLAAGASTRMGRPKQLALLNGRPLLEHVLGALQPGGRPDPGPVDEVIVALGAAADDVKGQVDLHGATPLLVEGWRGGMGEVLARALASGDLGDRFGAVVVCLGDQPLVTGAVVARLVDAWRAGGGPVVSASYHGRPGNPKLFDRRLFPELRRLRGDEGARGLLAAHPEWVTLVEVGTLGGDADVDDEAALARLEAMLEQEAEEAEG